MKTRTIAIVTLLCLAFLFLWWHRRLPEKQLNSENPVMVIANAPQVAKMTRLEPSPSPSEASTRIEDTPPNPRTMDSNAYVKAFAEWWRTSGQVAIDFYGKVIDENSNAVAGAIVNFSWDEDREPRSHNTVSDGDGLFSLQNKRGTILEVAVSKEGYYTPKPGFGGYVYTTAGQPQFSPDLQNPVIFKLRKKGKGELLIEKEFPPGMGQIAQLRHDGTPVEVDLLNGQKAALGAGQLKLELWRDVSEENAKAFDWKLQLSVPGGGLLATDQEFAYQAPENGYKPFFVIDMPKTYQGWGEEIRTKFYIRLPDGKYGRIDFYLLAYNGVFTIKSYLNPTGSRNLEPEN